MLTAIRPRAVLGALALVMGLALVPVLAGQAPESVALEAGCTNVVLAYPAGTPLATVAATVHPPTSLTGIFRFNVDLGRFAGYSPTAPDVANDYPAVTAPLEAVFVCMTSAGTIARGGGAIAPPPTPMPTLVSSGVVSAPREVRRGETATVILGARPGHVCIGGVNMPEASTFRFVPIEATASASGSVLIRFESLESDAPGFAYLAVQCADGQVIRLEFRVV